MRTRIIHTPFHSGDLISERAARRVTAHRRPVVGPERAEAAGASSSPGLATLQPNPSPADGLKILRRWSVAELVARAAAGPPVVA